MTYEMKDGSFSLFKNDKKLTEKHPDYKGSIKINGVEHWFDAWLKKARMGSSYRVVLVIRNRKVLPPRAMMSCLRLTMMILLSRRKP
jgi:hypothetical protein